MARLRLRSPLILVLAAPLLAAALVGLTHLLDPEEVELGGLVMDFAENLFLVGVMLASAFLVQRVDVLEKDSADIRSALDHARHAGEQWRSQSRRLVQGLSAAIEQQFADWALTPAEAEVAGLMLKGMSLREIAELRRTSEATIRQQAQSVYRKSGLANRAELSAYFLEDLFSVAGDSLAEPAGAVPPLN